MDHRSVDPFAPRSSRGHFGGRQTCLHGPSSSTGCFRTCRNPNLYTSRI